MRLWSREENLHNVMSDGILGNRWGCKVQKLVSSALLMDAWTRVYRDKVAIEVNLNQMLCRWMRRKYNWEKLNALSLHCTRVCLYEYIHETKITM